MRRRGDNHRCLATKAGFLNSHLPILDQLAGAGADFEDGNRVSEQVDDRMLSHRIFSTFLLPLLKTLACVCLATIGLLSLDRLLPITLFPIVYLIPVVIAATRWGTWPAVAAALAGGAATDFFFFTPFYSFRMDDPQEVIDLLLYLFVALVSGHLASRLRSEKNAVRQREIELQYLYEFSRRLAACFTIPDLISAIQDYLSHSIGQPATFLVARTDGHLEALEGGAAPKEVEAAA